MICTNCQIDEIHPSVEGNYFCEEGHMFCRRCTSLIGKSGFCPECGMKLLRKEKPVADLHSSSSEQVVEITSRNFSKLFQYTDVMPMKDLPSEEVNKVESQVLLEKLSDCFITQYTESQENSHSDSKTAGTPKTLNVENFSKEESKLFLNIIAGMRQHDSSKSKRSRKHDSMSPFFRSNMGFSENSLEDISDEELNLGRQLTKQPTPTRQNATNARTRKSSKRQEKVESLDKGDFRIPRSVDIGTMVKKTPSTTSEDSKWDLPETLPNTENPSLSSSGSSETNCEKNGFVPNVVFQVKFPPQRTRVKSRSPRKRNQRLHDARDLIRAKLREEIYSVFNDSSVDASKYVEKREDSFEAENKDKFIIIQRNNVERRTTATESSPKPKFLSNVSNLDRTEMIRDIKMSQSFVVHQDDHGQEKLHKDTPVNVKSTSRHDPNPELAYKSSQTVKGEVESKTRINDNLMTEFFKLIQENATEPLRELIFSCLGQNDVEESVQPKQVPVSTPKKDEKYETIIGYWYANPNSPLTSNHNMEPEPQLLPKKVSILRAETPSSEVRYASGMQISREPITCPITSCGKNVSVSDFSYHMVIDHTKTPVEVVKPGICKNLFLDPRAHQHGAADCNHLLLIKDKIRGFGNRKHKDYLPLMLMIRKVSLLELLDENCHPQDEAVRRFQQQFLMIWLTGIMPNDFPIHYSLVVWSCSTADSKSKCHIVRTDTVYSIRNDHSPKELYKTRHGLLLSQEHCRVLMNGGKNFIEVQVLIH